MDASSSSQNVTAPTTLGEHAIISASPLSAPANSGSLMEKNESVEESIERSKSHWSEVVKLNRSIFHKLSKYFYDKEKADNRKVFRELQSHPTWGLFFITFGYDLETTVPGRPILGVGELVIGEKFAEGGQAELFCAHVIWKEYNEFFVENGWEWVVKVFKKGTSLRQLQVQWPHGYLQFKGEAYAAPDYPHFIRYHSEVMYGVLLKDGRFAFLMRREYIDLRCDIERQMLEIGQGSGPFSKDHCEAIMYKIAKGMEWLHEHNIVHRDLKASNVLVSKKGYVYVADFECSIGVVGTGFWRAPEILQAIKDEKVGKRPEVFSREADVYAYGMTCYEILTGKLPFENHPLSDYSIVFNGARPEVPKYVEDWMNKLLSRCWEHNLSKRPSFKDILDILTNHSTIVKVIIEEEDEKLRGIER
ncbi:hypothetical protein M758_2G058200 [Ceratodon purpureus]|nr:hypothetical protein M758_2G058200 [Ceratodon purpureus]